MKQPQRAIPRAIGAVEGEDGLDHLAPGDDGVARRERRCIEMKCVRASLTGTQRELTRQRVLAAKGREMPGEAEQISPMAVGCEQVGQGALVAARQRRAECG